MWTQGDGQDGEEPLPPTGRSRSAEAPSAPRRAWDRLTEGQSRWDPEFSRRSSEAVFFLANLLPLIIRKHKCSGMKVSFPATGVTVTHLGGSRDRRGPAQPSGRCKTSLPENYFESTAVISKMLLCPGGQSGGGRCRCHTAME